jgi:voltage-gated potassium channel
MPNNQISKFLKDLHNVNNNFNLIQKIILVFILLSVFVAVLESEDSIYQIFRNYFYYVNNFFAIFFLIEYLIRFFTIHYTEKYRSGFGHIKYLFSFYSIIDLLSFVPFFLLANNPQFFLLRLFRLFRILKMAKVISQTKFIRDVFGVLAEKKKEIILSISITIFVIFVASVCLYLVEGNIQPEQFGSIPRAFWWATITLTTIGYGDVYPITFLGKLFTIIITVFGIGTVAIPAGIIAGAFSKK